MKPSRNDVVRIIPCARDQQICKLDREFCAEVLMVNRITHTAVVRDVKTKLTWLLDFESINEILMRYERWLEYDWDVESLPIWSSVYPRQLPPPLRRRVQ